MNSGIKKSKVYICYEEKSKSVSKIVGSDNKIFVTNKLELAKTWAEKEILRASNYGFFPEEESYKQLFFDNIGQSVTDLWLFENGQKNLKMYYGLFIEFHDTDKDETILKQLF